MEVTEEEAALIEAQEAAKKSGKPVEEAKPAAAGDEEEKKEGEEDDKDKGEAPNAANGGSTDLYDWEQTLGELTVNVHIPEGTTGKMLTVDIQKTHLKVGIKGKPLMIDGELCKPIKKGDSLWCIETLSNGERCLQLNLTKKD